jgi:hypothetical protein
MKQRQVGREASSHICSSYAKEKKPRKASAATIRLQELQNNTLHKEEDIFKNTTGYKIFRL